MVFCVFLFQQCLGDTFVTVELRSGRIFGEKLAIWSTDVGRSCWCVWLRDAVARCRLCLCQVFALSSVSFGPVWRLLVSVAPGVQQTAFWSPCWRQMVVNRPPPHLPPSNYITVKPTPSCSAYAPTLKMLLVVLILLAPLLLKLVYLSELFILQLTCTSCWHTICTNDAAMLDENGSCESSSSEQLGLGLTAELLAEELGGL